MLYAAWRRTVEEHADQVALIEMPSRRRRTFAELDAALTNFQPKPEPIAYVEQGGAEFVLRVLAAWKAGRVTCPVEAGHAVPSLPPPPEDVAHLKITSGTTGQPRAIAFTARQLMADGRNIRTTMGLRREWPNVAAVSLAHSYGFSNLILPLVLDGVPLILAESALPASIAAVLEEFDGVTLPGVPVLWQAWHGAGVLNQRVRLAISAGAPLPVELEQRIHAASGVKVHNFYGASECGGIAFDRTELPREDDKLIGEALDGVCLTVENDCLVVAGEAVGAGYWPEREPSLDGGRFVTSDLAAISDGEVRLHGRVSDVINRGGRKIEPQAVEAVIRSHPAVEACLVFGVPANDASRGERIVAAVVLANATRSGELARYVADRLPAWQCPQDWWVLPELFANERGKTPRRAWRERYLRERRTERP